MIWKLFDVISTIFWYAGVYGLFFWLAIYLFGKLKELHDISDVAFGAKFFPYLQKSDLKVSLYEPEIMSKFLRLDDMKLFGSSFDERA